MTAQKKWHIANTIYGIVWIYSLIHNIRLGNANGIFMTGVAAVTPCLIPFLFHCMHWQPVYEIYLINTIFIFFASLGSPLGGYSVPGFDKALHFVSGFLVLTIAMILFYGIRGTDRLEDDRTKILFYVFINACNMAGGLIWEYYEFMMLVLFNNDAINHYTTGVYDSITDMMCSTAAGLVLTFLIIKRKKLAGFFLHTAEQFYQTNIQKADR